MGYRKTVLSGAVFAGAIVTALSLSACDASSNMDGDMAMDDNGMIDTDSHPLYNSGELSGEPPAAVSDVQARVASLLAEGLRLSAFEGLRQPETALFKAGPRVNSQPEWERVGERYRPYLVARHLQPASPDLCGDGRTAYTGYIAARPFLRSEFHAEAMIVTEAFPYGLIVCDSGDASLEIDVVSADHPALGDFDLPEMQFMEDVK